MATSPPTLNDADGASIRCAAYSLIAQGFRYPDNEWLSSLSDQAPWAAWAGRLGETHGEASTQLAALRGVIATLGGASVLNPLQEQFDVVFGHSVRGACPPYELEFGRSEIIQRASDLADISGFYAAFGMELGGEISERADHISVEAEFLAVLCAKEACGLENMDPALVESARSAQRAFLKSHLGHWLPAFTRQVLESKPCDFYCRLSGFANAFVTCDCQRLGVSLGSPYLELRPVDAIEEAAQSCGVPGECGEAKGEQFTQLNVAIDSDG